jgi:hypothetical protein
MIHNRLTGKFRAIPAAVALVLMLPLPRAGAESGPGRSARYVSLPSDPEVARPRPHPRQARVPALDVEPAAILSRSWAPMRCLPGPLGAIVADVAARYGGVSVESTQRSPGHNRRVGGADHSLHIACRAVDLRVRRGTGRVMAYLRSRPDVGGLKVYRNGIIHIDDGMRRSW